LSAITTIDARERCLLPSARGPLTDALTRALLADDETALPAAVTPVDDPLTDDDLQLALWICYELHYRGFDDVDDDWEWRPSLLGLRAELEQILLDALRREVTAPQPTGALADQLWKLIRDDDSPSLSRFLQRDADRDQYAEVMVHRSIYQLKEADPHTWAIPKLSGRAKAAMVEIQADEYGQGDLRAMHSELFRHTLVGLGLADDYGFYVDAVPGITLAISNVISLFGLHNSLVGALAGHLAAYEMTSSDPSRRTARGLRRLGADDDTCRFFDVHVTADSLHEQLAAHDLCEGLADARPELAGQILFGAAVSLYVDRRFAEHLLGAWKAGRTSLRLRSLMSGTRFAVTA
jgi:hypothetical protein